jgi:hypothetical protein
MSAPYDQTDALAVIIEPDEEEEQHMSKKRRLSNQSKLVSIEKDQDMAETLLSLKAAVIPGSPETCKPLCHPQAFQKITTRKIKRKASIANRGRLSLVDYDEVAAISEDEHEESCFTKKRQHREIKADANRSHLTSGVKLQGPKMTLAALQMPSLFRSPWTPNNTICNGIPIFTSQEQTQMNYMEWLEKNSSDHTSLSFPMGRPLPAAPRLPKLHPGQQVVLS